MIRSILVPLDGSKESEAALPEVRRLVPEGGKVHLLHVIPVPTPPVGDEPTRFVDLPEQALAYLADVRNRFKDLEGFDLVVSGEPEDRILRTALQYNMQLIAMGSHARTGVARWLYGNVGEAVVRQSQLPVLLVPSGIDRPRRGISRILVPLDGSEHALSVLPTVEAVAERTLAEIVLLYVKPVVHDPSPQWAFPTPLSVRTDPAHQLEELADRLEAQGRVAWSLIAHGDPVEEILRHARLQEVDLIAMATHSRAGLERMVEGSVAERVLKATHLPVILQKPVTAGVMAGMGGGYA